MRALRIFYANRHLLNLSVPKSLSIPRLSRHLHSAFLLRCAEPSRSPAHNESSETTTRRGWSIYGRAPGRLPSQTVSSSSDGNEGAKRPNDRVGNVVRNKKKGKGKVNWVCNECGYSDGQWWGSCRECNAAGTMTRFSEGNSSVSVSEAASASWLPQHAGEVRPLRLTDVSRGVSRPDWRIPL
jgi:DNA repair protein RadA/Sms